MPLSVVLGALGSLRLLSSLQFILFPFRALVDCNSFTEGTQRLCLYVDAMHSDHIHRC
jgi:hypothetical protein